MKAFVSKLIFAFAGTFAITDVIDMPVAFAEDSVKGTEEGATNQPLNHIDLQPAPLVRSSARIPCSESLVAAHNRLIRGQMLSRSLEPNVI